MAAKESIKFAGPDADGHYRVLATRNTYLVEPGQIYTAKVYKELMDMAKRRGERNSLDVQCVEYKPSGAHVVLDKLLR